MERVIKKVKCTNEVKEDEDLGKVFEFGDQKGIGELAANPFPSAQLINVWVLNITLQ